MKGTGGGKKRDQNKRGKGQEKKKTVIEITQKQDKKNQGNM